MYRLVINGMKLQPCMPSYFQARDAIILADAQLTGGENYCEIWKAFSSRGLGPNATFRPRDPWGGGSRKNVSNCERLTCQLPLTIHLGLRST